MPTIEDRIAAAQAVVAAQKKKLEEHRLNVKIREGEAKLAKLETDRAKQLADQKRRDDARAKIILGAAVLLLSPVRFVRVMIELVALLTIRDREWIQRWCSGRGISLDQAEDFIQHVPDSKQVNVPEPDSKVDGLEEKKEALGTDVSEVPCPIVPMAVDDPLSKLPKALEATLPPVDPVGEALKRAIGAWTEAEVAWLAPEILVRAEADDRRVIQEWFASHTQHRASEVEKAEPPESILQSN